MSENKHDYDQERLFILETIKELKKAVEKFSTDVIDLRITMGKVVALYAIISTLIITVVIKSLEKFF